MVDFVVGETKEKQQQVSMKLKASLAPAQSRLRLGL
jgi:hypothetical protein